MISACGSDEKSEVVAQAEDSADGSGESLVGAVGSTSTEEPN